MAAVSLLDVAPSLATKTVAVAGQEIEVRGLSNSQIAKVMRRFPDFGKVFTGANGVNPASLSRERAEEAGIEFDPDAALAAGLSLSEAIPAVIAAGVGHADDKRYEDAADRLPAEDQNVLVEAIMFLTKPKATPPLAESAPAEAAPVAP